MLGARDKAVRQANESISSMKAAALEKHIASSTQSLNARELAGTLQSAQPFIKVSLREERSDEALRV